MSNFSKVKEYLYELEYDILTEDTQSELVVVANHEQGITGLVIDCEDPILVMEQHIFDVKSDNADVYKDLLKINREVIHGGFALDDTGKKVIFRDTLELENLDLNELEGSLNSLAMMLSEYSDKILKFAKL